MDERRDNEDRKVSICASRRVVVSEVMALMALMPMGAEVGVIVSIQSLPDLPGGRRP